MLAALVNGSPAVTANVAIAVDDRGLNYGDGLFETMLLTNGAIRFLHAHLQRLAASCERLSMSYPGDAVIENDIETVRGKQVEGVIKVLVTRGVGGRGYKPVPNVPSTRVATLHAMPASKADVRARWCETRLSRNPVLAGMKHTNRLEQVLAASEWNDESIDEGLMRDFEGEVVCGTSSNVFIVRNGELVTPDLRFSGVRGVMRDQVLRLAQSLHIPFHEEPLYPHDFDSASEVFVTNAVRGIRAVIELGESRWSRGPMTDALCKALDSHA